MEGILYLYPRIHKFIKFNKHLLGEIFIENIYCKPLLNKQYFYEYMHYAVENFILN